ncbi:MAG: hypothetical protein V1928_02795 [Parcubacteria group bacterium]
MYRENIALKSVKFVLKETVADIVRFPVWWYAAGTKKAFKKMVGSIASGDRTLGLSIWVKNIFTPMFGQYDWQGRIISFFMRLFQIIVRMVLWLLWIIFSAVLFLFWLILPVLIILEILFNLK